MQSSNWGELTLIFSHTTNTEQGEPPKQRLMPHSSVPNGHDAESIQWPGSLVFRSVVATQPIQLNDRLKRAQAICRCMYPNVQQLPVVVFS